ncbi:suppressor of fused domain protein [Actinomadura luteofluorescens]|uniref:suppressor of fused domain protein n=1 Tax=Actinomadura luteofluorescens TaxID=46163 RepID=UPI00347D3B15
MSDGENTKLDLIEHFERYLGEIHKVYSGEQPDGHIGYDLVEYHVPEPGVTWVATNGLRFQPITTMVAQELVCGLWDQQGHVAHHLVVSMASLVLKNAQGFEYDRLFANDVPIVEGTSIEGVLACPNPVYGQDFDLVHDASGKLRIQVITLVPITRAEIGFVEKEGAEMLWEVFRLNRTNILDVTRRSAV